MPLILNLTQHSATPEQLYAGVVDLMPDEREMLCRLLTFDDLPTSELIVSRAERIATLAERASTSMGGHASAMIGGAPFLMPSLERALRARGIEPLYAFSRREVIETVGAEGGVRKTAVFRHIGFVAAQ